MPGFDGTGPYGTGPMGLGLGPCGRGLAFRRGYGRGFGWRHWRRVPMRYWDLPSNEVVLTKEEQKEILEAELKELEAEKQEIEKKLKELK